MLKQLILCGNFLLQGLFQMLHFYLPNRLVYNPEASTPIFNGCTVV